MRWRGLGTCNSLLKQEKVLKSYLKEGNDSMALRHGKKERGTPRKSPCVFIRVVITQFMTQLFLKKTDA